MYFRGKLRLNPLKKCDLVRKVLGKSVCDAYLCRQTVFIWGLTLTQTDTQNNIILLNNGT